jgi:hypothetical protein
MILLHNACSTFNPTYRMDPRYRFAVTRNAGAIRRRPNAL